MFLGACKSTNEGHILFRDQKVSKDLFLGNGCKVRDLFIEDVPGTKSYWLGPWIEIVRDDRPGEFYIVKGYNRFYIQVAPPHMSSLKFYGPFIGIPEEYFK